MIQQTSAANMIINEVKSKLYLTSYTHSFSVCKLAIHLEVNFHPFNCCSSNTCPIKSKKTRSVHILLSRIRVYTYIKYH